MGKFVRFFAFVFLGLAVVTVVAPMANTAYNSFRYPVRVVPDSVQPGAIEFAYSFEPTLRATDGGFSTQKTLSGFHANFIDGGTQDGWYRIFPLDIQKDNTTQFGAIFDQRANQIRGYMPAQTLGTKCTLGEFGFSSIGNFCFCRSADNWKCVTLDGGVTAQF